MIPSSPPPRFPSRDKSAWCPAAGLYVPAHSHWRPPSSSAPDVLRPESTGGERDNLSPAPHQLSPTIGCASPSRTTVGDSLVHPPRSPPSRTSRRFRVPRWDPAVHQHRRQPPCSALSVLRLSATGVAGDNLAPAPRQILPLSRWLRPSRASAAPPATQQPLLAAKSRSGDQVPEV